MKRNKQPCWSCKRSCGACSWSFDFTPIKGWEAEESIISENGQAYKSFKIKSCPQYEREEDIQETQAKLAAKYGVSQRTIARWLKLGVIKRK